MSTRQDEQVGARRVASGGGGGFPWWAALLALLVLLALAAAAWFLLADDDSHVEVVDNGATATTAPATPTTAATTATSTPATSGNPSIRAGEVFAGGQRVLPGGESQLNRFIDQPAEGRTVRVTSVPSDEGFWVGTSATNRVFVHLALAPQESPFNVQAGETVSFTGTMKALPPNVGDRWGITAAEGLEDLRRQGAYIQATNVRRG